MPSFKLPFQITKRELAGYLDAKDPTDNRENEGSDPGPALAAHLVMANIEMAINLSNGGFTRWKDKFSDKKVRKG